MTASGRNAKRFVRYDLTSTRKYSLSPQTRRVLTNLDEPITITTAFRANDPQQRAIVDLIDEYGRLSDKVTVRHLDPLYDLTGLEELAAEVTQRYDAELADVRAAVTGGLEAATNVRGELEAVGQGLEALAAQSDADPRDAEDAHAVRRRAGAVRRATCAVERNARG